MKQKVMMTIALLCLVVQGAWAWNGSGTSADPYQIQTSADWKQLADDVSGGKSYSGQYFEMIADVDAQGVSVGNSDKPFSGTFSGGMYTLTYNRGTSDSHGPQTVDDYCAPFVRLDGATIRDLKVTGAVYSSHKYAAGIASLIDGATVTTIDGCHVSSLLFASNELSADATFGGIVALVNATCGADPVISNCSFTGSFTFYPTRSGGFVGYANRAVNFNHCMFDPQETAIVDGCATYARMHPEVTCTFKECYFTQVMGTEQGEAVFNEVSVPEGCSYRFVSEADAPFNGVNYYKSGAVIELTAPDDMAFDHWATNVGGCWISNPWQRSGLQTVRDIYRKPYFQIETSMPAAKLERDIDGTKYRFLYNFDYHLYISDEEIAAKNYHFDDKGELFKWDAEGNHIWITAVVGWVPGKIPSDGAQIHNDLSGWGKDYTFLGAVAPQAFQGCTELKTLYFKDTDANNFNARGGFDFVIGDRAFADCPNLTEIKMMQYTTKGDNHWEALNPGQVTSLSDSVFAGSPKANFSVDASEYQNYLSSATWKNFQNRIIVYNHTDVDMTVNGAKYSYMRNTKGEALKNTNADHTALMETLRYWNADYQNFTASSLLSTSDASIWYTNIVGCDDDYLKKNDGTMRIYNDPGSYYNYKTLAIGRNAFQGSKELKHIEFWQTNGRSENSLSDLKMVIQNGAFKGCTNLKELRMFYYVQDGDDHWEALGPQDVIPSDNILGRPSYEDTENLSQEEVEKLYKETLPQDFKILVSPDRYQEFLKDPNWLVYEQYIEPTEFNPNNSDMKDFSLGGLTYGYMTSPGGVMQTSQTVSQDVSWWTATRIGVEVALDLISLGSIYSARSELLAAEESLRGFKDELETMTFWSRHLIDHVDEVSYNVPVSECVKRTIGSGATKYTKDIFKLYAKRQFMEDLMKAGLVTAKGEFASGEALANVLARLDNRFIIGWGQDRVVDGLKTFIAYARQHITSGLIPDLEGAVKLTTSGFIKDLSAQVTQLNLKVVSPSAIAPSITTASYYASNLWGGTGSYNGDLLQKGMRENIKSNMNQVGLVGGGYVITTPQKNLCYHTYIKDVPASTTDAVIYAGTGKGQGRNNNARTTTMGKQAFRDHTNLKTVKFHETGVQSDEAMPMLFTIPDSAFVGCTNLQTLDLRVETESNGLQPLGPESFILGGDSIFAGLDPAKFHIIIDPKRKQDFLDNKSWKPLEKYFIYEDATPKTQYQEYGGNYAYAYENGTTQKVNKVSGHKIEHTVVTGADDEFLTGHQGALKLCNDIGVYNNYQLDAVTKKAFLGNQNLRVVNFTDLKGTGAYGDSYTGLEMALNDSCFADCKNLANLDMIYLVTDGDNHIDPIRPEQVTIGRGVLDGTTAKIKMMPQQVAWFEADSMWAKYKDRFMPCIIKCSDEGVKKALKQMPYYDMAHTGYDPTTWDEYIDLARIAGAGFSWLDGRFREESDNLRSFADFKYFESVGLDYVGKEWFRGCVNLSNIVLPKTVKTIQELAFASCFKLEEIELPAAVTEIGGQAFDDCRALKTIRVLGTTPAKLTGSNQFLKLDGLKIYVPAAAVDAYKTAWADYAAYIVSDDTYNVTREVTLTEAGTLAEKLGLYVEWSYAGAAGGDEPRYIHGNYAKYDSLVVHGPLNDFDLWTIRYLTGNNGYDRGGTPTDGGLRYLNLYDTRIVKDDNKAHYLNKSWGIKWAWLDIKNANELPYNLFYNCTALESIVLPKTLTKINARIFEGCSSLKRLAVPASLQDYDTWEYFQGLLDYPLEELVFVTNDPAVSSRSNPWQQEVGIVYTKQSQLSDYMNQPYLTSVAQTVTSPFEDDAVMETLAERGQFFPSEYLLAEKAENLFNDNTTIKTFDEFNKFSVRSLDRTFTNASALKRITLPDSLQHISAEAFMGCTSLDTIRISTDKIPQLAQDAFKDLSADFRILVPKDLCNRYRDQWAQYADHINVDNAYYSDEEWTEVTLTEPNTLAEKLGFEVNWDYRRMTVFSDKHNYINGVRGDYSKIHKLKVSGPISGSDFAIMRYLAGFCPWSNDRNLMGQLEAIDLYDADIKATDDLAAPDMFKVITHLGQSYVQEDNQLPSYAFLQAYNLKSLVLPKSCTKIETRALQQCEALETLVLGDDLTDFDWSALDDDVMLTRLYILAKKKPEMTQDNWLVRQLYNNYNPTFDAFYVRPTLYNEYLNDRAYTHDMQRTNLISKGVFDDDDSFCAFAKHAAATQDDLTNVYDVEGWFDAHPAAKNLTPLKYTIIDSLKTATIAPLTQLESIALPVTLSDLQDGVFEKATRLRYADFLMCDSTNIVSKLRDGGLAKLGIDTGKTLAYVPATYGDTDETNVVVGSSTKKTAATFRLVDSLDYMVPYAFETKTVENSRKLAKSEVPYTMCVPYSMYTPSGCIAYELTSRENMTLTFTEVEGELEAQMPYLILATGGDGELTSDIQQTIPASGGATYGYQIDVPGYTIRGTLKGISNADAADLGAYILQKDGKWHPVSTASQKACVLPFRAYLLPSTHSNGARTISMSLENADGTTAISTIRTIDADGTERLYDLNGRRIDGAKTKGIVIKNGRKVIK